MHHAPSPIYVHVGVSSDVLDTTTRARGDHGTAAVSQLATSGAAAMKEAIRILEYKSCTVLSATKSLTI